MSRRTRLAVVEQPRQAVLIGTKLRTARKLRGLTLDQVARSAGLTKGFVSRLERDDVSPSVASLVSVCDVLGLRVGELFDPPRTSVIRAGEGQLINFGGEGAVERLVTPGTQTALEVIHSVIEPGGNGGEELYALSCDAECAYVLSGTVEVVLEDHTETLSAGDAMTFPGNSPHTWRNPGPRPCKVLWILAPAP
ncbi:MAG: cupin domain-containing protein [Nocardioidaceae bacterium]|nr:cupin domain-containing protein [Nocardioidaceae bacterium]NUS52751.1 cupin domain-containing protein [Nocardioidaceae bacterium]